MVVFVKAALLTGSDDDVCVTGSLIPPSAIGPLTAMLSDHTKNKPPLPIPVQQTLPRTLSIQGMPWQPRLQQPQMVPLRTTSTTSQVTRMADGKVSVMPIPAQVINLSSAGVRLTGATSVAPRQVINLSSGRGGGVVRMAVPMQAPRPVINLSTGIRGGVVRMAAPVPVPRPVINLSSGVGVGAVRMVASPAAPRSIMNLAPRPATPVAHNPRLVGFGTPPVVASSSGVVNGGQQPAVAPASSPADGSGGKPKPQVLNMPMFL